MSVSNCTRPAFRHKPGWYGFHRNHVNKMIKEQARVIVLGDSLPKDWLDILMYTVNCGIRGDSIQNLLWRVDHLSLPVSLHVAVLLCGTNNIQHDEDIAEGVIAYGSKLLEKDPPLHVVITGILPRDQFPSVRRNQIQQINSILKSKCWTKGFTYTEPSSQWVSATGELANGLYYRPSTSKVYNFWKLNYQVTVHRSNDRYLINISPSNLAVQTTDIVHPDIKTIDTKRGLKFQGYCMITTKTYRELHESFKTIYASDISIGTFLNLKPFYVSPPTIKEMEMCMCGKCLNPHCIYKALKQSLSNHDFPTSLSEFLGKKIQCDRDQETNYFELECILGKCGNSCQIINIKDYCKPFLKAAKNKTVSFYVFEKVTTFYYNKNGEKVGYDRTGRVDKNWHINEIIDELQSMASKYLQHYFFVINDRVYWKRFLDSSTNFTLWLDYSQNIAFKEKKQVQSAHFSGKQHTLHNTLIRNPNGNNIYVYHLSDDTNHDTLITFEVINDIIKNDPDVIN